MAEGSPQSMQPKVTRDVEPAALPDLLAHPPRASLAYVDGDSVTIVPARARCDDGVWHFMLREADCRDLEGQEIVLIMDDGPYWFELRGISARGIAKRAAAKGDAAGDGLAHYTVEVRRLLSWDYGAVREE